MNCHLISVKEIIITRIINVNNRVACNITKNKFFYKLKIKLKHHESSKHLKIILNYRFSQYFNNIKFQEILFRKIEVKNKVEVETTVNKEEKKKNITKKNIKINQLIREIEIRDVTRNNFIICKNVLIKAHKCYFL